MPSPFPTDFWKLFFRNFLHWQTRLYFLTGWDSPLLTFQATLCSHLYKMAKALKIFYFPCEALFRSWQYQHPYFFSSFYKIFFGCLLICVSSFSLLGFVFSIFLNVFLTSVRFIRRKFSLQVPRTVLSPYRSQIRSRTSEQHVFHPEWTNCSSPRERCPL
jgi:hypothetical protein